MHDCTINTFQLQYLIFQLMYNDNMKHLLPLFLLSISLFFGFVLFSYLVHEDVFTAFDFDTTVRLQDNIPRRFDSFFSWFSVFGNFELLLGVLIIFFVLMRKFLAGFIAFCMFGFFHIVEIFGKFYVDHPPPPEFMLRTERLVDFPQFHVRAEFSYPSGHSGRTVFLASIFITAVLMSNLPKQWKVILVSGISGFVFVMLLSRPYLGEHWATDVIGGALLGASFGLFSALFLDNNLSMKNILHTIQKLLKK